MAIKESLHGSWSSRWAFILAATGSAVGLGNIWKFPYMTGQNGGGAFVIVYLVCIALIGIPIMMSEVMLGRRGRQSPVNTMKDLAIESGHSPHWKWLGIVGVAAGFIILSYYSVVAGWSLSYLFNTAQGDFVGLTADGVGAKFSELIGDPVHLLFWHTFFMGMVMVVISRGVRSGLERAVSILMPALFVLMVILLIYAMSTAKFAEGVAFLFTPDFSKLSTGALLSAMGHAFFTLSLGMGAIMVYGSYLPSNTSIAKTTLTIAFIDTLVAVLAGLVIFPIVFSNGLEPDQGAGLVFVTLPLAFGQMPGGVIFGTVFFLLLTFAAWTSGISLLEPAVTWLVENKGVKRLTATFIGGFTIWLLGIVTVMSFHDWGFEFEFPPGSGTKYETGFFDIFDILTANIMLPLGGLLIAIFAGWFMSRDASRDELDLGSEVKYKIWRILARYVAPTAILIVFFELIGLLDVVIDYIYRVYM